MYERNCAMKKRILCLLAVLALCLCLCTMFAACTAEEPETEEPVVEDENNNTPEEPEAPEGEEEEPATESDKKGEFHPTPNAGGADVNINEPNEQLPDSTLRG